MSTTTITKKETLVGKRIKRREDPRLITGTATYVDDIQMPGMHHACLLRSPHAAARIKTDRGTVRDEARKTEVLGNVAREAEAVGLEPERLRAVWDELVEQSIAYEAVQWDRLRADR